MDIKDFERFLNDQQMNKRGMSADYDLYSSEGINRTHLSPEAYWGQGMFRRGDT